jgi:hypothetical protein
MTDPLTALRDVPTLLAPERIARARAATHDRIDALIAPPQRRRRGARRAGALALAALAAAGALVFTEGGGAGGPGVATAAGRAARARPPRRLSASAPARPGRVLRRAHPPAAGREAGGRGGRRHDDVDGGRPRARADPPERPPAASRARHPAGAARPARSRLVDLPDGPGRPRAAHAGRRSDARRPRNVEPSVYDYVLTATFMIFGHDRVPPAGLQGVYGFLAGLPGIRLVGEVTDPLGRPGTAVGVDGDRDRENIGIELLLDRTNGLPLAIVHYRDGDIGKPWLYTTRQEGIVHGTDALPK